MPEILTEATAEYLSSIRPPADELVEEMEDHASEEGVPIAAREVARLQAILAGGCGADRVLEVGTAIGYSTLHVARTGATVVTLEVDDERIAAARDYLERDGITVRVVDDAAAAAQVDDGVVIVRGPALETMPELAGPFDVVFVDAVKEEYADYLELALAMLRVGGLVLVDNLLWQGQVPTEPIDESWRESTEALRAFNEAFVGHDVLDAIVSPLGDGTGIATKVE